MTDTKRMPEIQLRDTINDRVYVGQSDYDGIYIDCIVLARDEARKLFFFLSEFLQVSEYTERKET